MNNIKHLMKNEKGLKIQFIAFIKFIENSSIKL